MSSEHLYRDHLAFIEALEACRLEAGEFSHSAHVRAAWYYLSRYGFDPGSTRFVEALRRFTDHHGVAHKFHCTLTRSLLCLIGASLADAPEAETWDAYCRRNPQFFGDPRALLRRYYTDAVLDSPRARTRFLAPDRAPLPRPARRSGSPRAAGGVALAALAGGAQALAQGTPPVEARCHEATADLELEAPVGTAFPLFDPVNEALWAEGWHIEPVYPVPFEVQRNAVFQTGHGGQKSTWTIIAYEPDDYRIEYLVVRAEALLARVTIVCRPIGAGRTRATVTYRTTALDEAGERHAERYSEGFIRSWEAPINAALEELRDAGRAEADAGG